MQNDAINLGWIREKFGVDMRILLVSRGDMSFEMTSAEMHT